MEEVTLVRGARQLLTLRGPAGPRRGSALRDLGIIQDGALLIRGGKIQDVGPSRRIENLAAARRAREINAAGRVVMPGFVDSHTHLLFRDPRNAIRATPARRLELRARALINGMVRHGTTTLEAKSGYGLDETTELKMLRVLASLNRHRLDVIPTYFGGRAVAPESEADADGYVDWMCSRVLPGIRRRRLARFADVSCDRGAFNLDQARRYLERARALGFQLKVHTEQFSRTGGVRLAVELEAVTADHLEQMNGQDVAILARSATIATLLPASVHHLGRDRYAPARALIDAGAAVALATGFSPEHCPTYSMQMVLALACSEMKMTPAEAICAATINGANALGCAGQAGSLEPCQDADLLLLNVPDYREIPYFFGVNHVHMVLKKGVTIYQEGGVTAWAEA